MASKTFVISRDTIGGIVTAEVLGDKITITVKDYDTKRVIDMAICNADWRSGELTRQMMAYLMDYIPYYHADLVMEWLSKHSMAFA